MHIPYVIDNISHRLADILNELLNRPGEQHLDIATAYFSIRGYDLVRQSLHSIKQFRLLLGDKPISGDDIGIRPDAREYLRNELNAEPLTVKTLQLVEELVRFLKRPDVRVRLYTGHLPDEHGRRLFLHAKCYLLYGATSANIFDALTPLVGIVGSSNFTAPGLISNRELNLVHKTVLSDDEIDDADAHAAVSQHADQHAPVLHPNDHRLIKSEVGARAILDLSTWYNDQWERALDYKQALIDLLEDSKFGGREYTPYEIYLKALYTYFKADLADQPAPLATRSAVELAEFQEDAVKKARRILAQYDGVIVADSVGLGKTWIGKKLLEDYAYHLRQKALVICPAALKPMWERELRSATIAATIVTQERLGGGELDWHAVSDVDVILVDEAHNFRNKRAKRYLQLEEVLASNGRRGRSGNRKKVILLTATPINNNIFDLYNQINLFTGNDRTYFASAGIGDLYNYFLAARRESVEAGSIRIFNLLEEVVIRRTRQFIQRAYPEAMIHGAPIRWPQRQLHTLNYDLAAAYEGLYHEIVRKIEGLHLAHYQLEAYKRNTNDQDDFELGRQAALVGIFKSRFLKRLESSIEAFRISIRRALEFVKTFSEYVQDDIILNASAFHTAMRLLDTDDSDDDADTPTSRAEQLDAHAETRILIEHLPKLETARYDRRRLHRALHEDSDALNAIWHAINHITIHNDAKLQHLQECLARDLKGKKLIIFTYYKDTARYLAKALTNDQATAWRDVWGNPTIRRVDSSVKSADRTRIISHFAPKTNNLTHDPDHEVDILIATDVLSEGQNLQDCGHLINYDLHWNPTRMVQRAGRIDRLGSDYETLHIYNMFPERELESLLGLVRNLTQKIDVINQTGFLDASVLGEVVTPRDFNTIKRIEAEDTSVIEEHASFLELASSESLVAELQSVLATDAQRWLTTLADGIHSGIQRQQAKGMFFYFTAQRDGVPLHFWRYYDAATEHITDNRYQIMQLINCRPDTPRFPPPYHELDVFAIQEKIIASIVQTLDYQATATLTEKIVASEQNVISEILASHLNNPTFERATLRELRKFLKEPLVGSAIQQLRQALNTYSTNHDIASLVQVVQSIATRHGIVQPQQPESIASTRLTRNDLKLVCYEYIAA